MTDDKELQQQQGANGIVTVNDGNNPTPEERDQRIPAETDTERLRSERQSVKDGGNSESSEP